MIWIEFLTCSSLMVFFAYKLCQEGVVLSRKTHIEEGLIGMFFLALATSFPEAVTGVTAVFYLGKTGLGYGDVMGSIIVNLMILVFLDYYKGKGRILGGLTRVTRLTGAASFLLIFTAFIFLLARTSGIKVPSYGGIGLESPIITIMYLSCLETVRRSQSSDNELPGNNNESMLQVWSKFLILLAVVTLLGVWLARTGEKISETTQLSQTFVGMLFLGVATSFPEMIVSFAALKAGSVNMAVGNILGSNLFDVFLVPLMDMFSNRPILGQLTIGGIVATSAAVLISMITVTALFLRWDTKRRVNLDTSLIFVVGVASFVILYFLK